MNNTTENSNNSGATDLETLDYLRGVKSSTCLLLPTTPSPTPLDFKHPLSEEMNELTFSTLNDDQNMVNIQTDASAGDSSSSADSNSVVQDPVSAQLINNISMLDYQTLSKNGDLIMGQTEDCKVNGSLNVNNRKLPSFVNWNWRIIRQVMLWIVLSGLVACLGAIIAMVVTIPKECNPDLPWYQGKVFYEIFPASFKDSNNDGTGDLKGIIKKLNYIEDLGASAIRLNYIFQAHNYPEQYSNITNLMQIDRSIGVLKDFQDLVVELHSRNMSLILDIPVISMASQVSSSNIKSIANNSLVTFDPTTAAIAYWSRAQNVDGFYLKNLENFVDDANFVRSLQFWKGNIGAGKILIASEKAYVAAKGNALNVLLSRIDLIDVHLDLHDGVSSLKEKFSKILESSLWDKPHYPWIQWNIGSIVNERISTKHAENTLAMIALELVLPGTISIFYGDEIGLGGLLEQDAEDDFHEHKYIHNVVAMNFSENINSANNGRIQLWNKQSSQKANYNFLDVIKKLIHVRMNTPTIYMKSTYKDGEMIKNVKLCKTEENLVVFDRWFRRRNTYVFVGNLGNDSITTDLSTMFYGGTVVAGTNMSLIGQVLYFEHITFLPNSAIVLKLEK